MATVVPTVQSYVVSDLTTDKGTSEGVKSFRVSFKVDATPEAIERVLASLRKVGVPADTLKLIDTTEGAAAGKGKGSESAAAAVREWARANNIEVGARGRINPEVQAQFDAAQAAS